MAWLKIFFEEKPAQAVPFTNAVAKVMGESYEVVGAACRVGSTWSRGNPDEARVKLSAVAETRPDRGAGDDPAWRATTRRRCRRRSTDAQAARASAVAPDRRVPRRRARRSAASRSRRVRRRATIEKVLAKFPKEWMRDRRPAADVLRGARRAGRRARLGADRRAGAGAGHGLQHQQLPADARARGRDPPGPVVRRADARRAAAVLPGRGVRAAGRADGAAAEAPAIVSQVVRLDQAQLLAMLERYPDGALPDHRRR